MTYTFTVPLVPKGASRPRFARLPSGQVRTYQTGDLQNWKAAVASCAASALQGVSLTGPTCVDIVAVFPRTKELLRVHGRGPNKGLPVHGSGRFWCPQKPDRDNIDKGILDALVPWLPDDKVVVCGETYKVYAAIGEAPHVEVTIQDAPILPLPIQLPAREQAQEKWEDHD